jgi:hypothetical protein
LLSKGKVMADLKLPARNEAKRILLRARVPDGWHVTAATADGKRIPADSTGSVDLSGLKGSVSVEFTVAKARTTTW